MHNYNENAELMGANNTKQFFRDNKRFVNKLKLKNIILNLSSSLV